MSEEKYYPGELQAANVWMGPTEAEYQPENRRWQGIASMERTKKGRLYSTFYSGGTTEGVGNFVVVTISDDDGKTWMDPAMILRHPDLEGMRLADPNVWLDPLGKLWIFWTQTHRYFDGRNGVWTIVCENPDAPVDELVFSAPRRIANGLMLNKPTVLKDGTWLMPCAIWICAKPCEDHPDMEKERFSNVYASTDNGETFVLRGGADIPNRRFDEHMVVERNDGSLWMMCRRYDGIGQAFSYDQGYTWTDEGHSGILSPCTRFFFRRLRSGNLLMVNHVDFLGPNDPIDKQDFVDEDRCNLMAKLSLDDGKTWVGGLMLDERGEVSYPDGTESDDGLIYITYDHERYDAREILMAVFTEEDILAGRLVDERSRLRVQISKALGPVPTKEEREVDET